jgi:hypothetical protein
MKKYHDNTLKVLKDFEGIIKSREIETERINDIEDQLDCELYNSVLILRNDRFEIEYIKKDERIKFSTHYSNIEIDKKFMEEVTELNSLLAEFEVRIENIKCWNKLQKEEEENNNISDELIEVETVKEHMDKEEQLIIESKKTPNYKKIFNNGLRTRKIYYITLEGEGYEYNNIIFTSKLELFEIYILNHNSSKSNFVFINKSEKIITRDFYKNNNDYTFTKVQ